MLKMKNVNIMGVHQFLGELGGGEGQKKLWYGELPKKELGQFAESLAKNKEECFGGGGT